jgi:D-hexose-6-phosphate mutarotase
MSVRCSQSQRLTQSERPIHGSLRMSPWKVVEVDAAVGGVAAG